MVHKDSLLILGAGGYGRMLAEAAQAAGQFARIAFLDDAAPQAEGRCADFKQFMPQYAYMMPAFGDNALREKWLDALLNAGVRVPNIIHPCAYISPSAQLGRGVAVLPHATVQGGAQIADGVIVNVNAVADHDCVIGRCAHLAPSAVVKAGACVPPLTKIESGSVAHRAPQPISKEGE